MQHLRGALLFIVTDEGFVNSSTRARATAEALMSFTQQNMALSTFFANKLVGKLQNCFHKSRSVRVQRERLCENLFKLRSSKAYQQMWLNFLREAVGIDEACPIFYQAVTDHLVEELARIYYPIASAPSSEATRTPALDNIEMNVIRYMAAYVIHSLKKKVTGSSYVQCQASKKEMLLCLGELEGDEG